MGRLKRVIKKIEEKIPRQVTFSKRRNGLLKKAKDLAVLCDAQIAAIIFSDRGKLYQYSSGSTSVPEILKRYHGCVEAEQRASTSVQENQDQNSKYAGFLTTGELLQIVERELEEPLIDQSANDLQHLENQLQDALIQTRSRKSHLLLDNISNLQQKEKSLENENIRLMKKTKKQKQKQKQKKVSKNKVPQKRKPKVAIDLNAPAIDETGNAVA